MKCFLFQLPRGKIFMWQMRQPLVPNMQVTLISTPSFTHKRRMPDFIGLFSPKFGNISVSCNYATQTGFGSCKKFPNLGKFAPLDGSWSREKEKHRRVEFLSKRGLPDIVIFYQTMKLFSVKNILMSHWLSKLKYAKFWDFYLNPLSIFSFKGSKCHKQI